MHGELLKFTEVNIAWGHNSSTLIIAFFLGCLNRQLFDTELVVKLDRKNLGEDRDNVVNLDLSFAAWAI